MTLLKRMEETIELDILVFPARANEVLRLIKAYRVLEDGLKVFEGMTAPTDPGANLQDVIEARKSRTKANSILEGES